MGGRFDPSKLQAAHTVWLQKHLVFDWLIGNFDAHKDQFVRLRGEFDGLLTIIAIDKGQAFKFCFNKQFNSDSTPVPQGIYSSIDSYLRTAERPEGWADLGDTNEFANHEDLQKFLDDIDLGDYFEKIWFEGYDTVTSVLEAFTEDRLGQPDRFTGLCEAAGMTEEQRTKFKAKLDAEDKKDYRQGLDKLAENVKGANLLSSFLDRVVRIPDAFLREIFKDYANHSPHIGGAGKYEEFMTGLIKHKNGIKKKFQEYHNSLPKKKETSNRQCNVM